MSRVLICSPMGIPLADIDARVWRAWKLNGYAEAQFLIATTDAKARDEFICPGNLLYITHSTLPDWVGIIDPPIKWNHNHIEVNAKSAEVIFDWRVPPIWGVNTSIGAQFRTVLEFMNSWNGLPVYPGDIWGSAPDTVYVASTKCSDYMARLVKAYGIDWSVTAKLEGNKLRLYANLYERRGQVTNFELNNSNTEASEPVLTDTGPIFNHVWVYSDAGEGGGRNYKDSRDDESIAKYGLRQIAEQGAGSADEGLQYQADNRLLDYKQPKHYITPAVLNKGGAFQHIALGNILRWRSSRVGFTGNAIGSEMDVRLEGFEYDEAQDKMKLVANAYYVKENKRQQLLDWINRR